MTRRPKKRRLPESLGPKLSKQTTAGAVDQVASGPVIQARRPYILLAICGLLILAVITVFGQTARHDFVNFDDDIYVYDNPRVAAGVTLKGLNWAFLQPRYVDYWRPLSFLSHMLDCQFYGLWAGGHHLTNVLVHSAAAVVLFLVLRAMTGRMWPSAFVAAVFAIHPLRVESVAWVTERKDVLGALFFVLTLAAYVRYARRPAAGRYVAVMALFAVGLMCKPTLVPLPLVLLLLDYWPLRRAGVRRLVLEKLPLLSLAAGSCCVTVLTGALVLRPVTSIPLLVRTGNALVAVPTYAGQLFWPTGLAPWYPDPQGGPAVWAVAMAVVGLAAVSAAVIVVRRQQPWLLTGWFWYLAMLTPIVSMSPALMDRFTYLSQIGLCLALTWAAAELTARWRWRRRAALCGVAAGAVAVLMIVAHSQTAHWQNSETLWTHTLACTSQNYVAHGNFGLALAGRGEIDKAIAHYRKALEIKPDYATALGNLGVALAGRGEVDEAITQYRKVLAIQPDFVKAHLNLGIALAGRGEVDEAIAHYRSALQIEPDYVQAHYSLGNALLGRGEVDEAIVHYRKALQIEPGFAQAHYNLGNALAGRGEVDEAIAHYRQAFQIKPDFAQAHYNLGNALVGRGKLDEAIQHYRTALDLASAHNDKALADVIRARIRSLQSGAPPGKAQ